LIESRRALISQARDFVSKIIRQNPDVMSSTRRRLKCL
jgi:hypothetical protein